LQSSVAKIFHIIVVCYRYVPL